MAGGGFRDAWLTTRDGIRLVSRIWQPPGPGPWPVLLMRQPYGRAIASTPTYAHPGWYAAHGFLVVVQDVRGQGDSEGDFAGFAQEAADTADTLRWARALPQSTGRVGCYGFSYQGFTPLVSDATDAAGRPDCLAVAMTGLDERHHWACSGGAHWWALGLGWGLQLAALACRRRGDHEAWQTIRRSLADGSFLERGPALLERHDPGGMAWRWLRADPEQPTAWRCHAPAAGLWQQPLLLLGGWHDPHLDGVLDLWQRSRAAGGQPWLRIGAWSHLNWGEGCDPLLLAFFRTHLQHQAPGPELAARVAVQNPRHGSWLALEATPPNAPAGPGACWWLQGDGASSGRGGTLRPTRPPDPSPTDPDPPASQGQHAWLVHDPWRPVPGRGGHLGLDAGCCERGDLDQRRDVLCFTSAPLERGLQLPTRPILRLRLRADQPGHDLCVALSRVTPTGRVLQLSTGVRRLRGPDCLHWAWRQVSLQPLLLDLEPGECLRLSLAGAAWPQIAVNPGDGGPAWGNSGPQHRVITLELELLEARLELAPCGLGQTVRT